jgi:virulence-associated protein VagC
MSETVRSKVFWSGGSQAVRVPKALRLPSNEVTIEKRGKALLVSPVADEAGWAGFWDRLLPLKSQVRRGSTRAPERRKPF